MQTADSKADPAIPTQSSTESRAKKPPPNGAKRPLTPEARGALEDELAFNQQAIAQNTSKAEPATSSQSGFASSERGLVSTPSLLSSRRVLYAQRFPTTRLSYHSLHRPWKLPKQSTSLQPFGVGLPSLRAHTKQDSLKPSDSRAKLI